MKNISFKKKLIASTIGSYALVGLSGMAMAQGNQMVAEEVVVTGIRGAQTTSVNIKRDASSIVDAISAEDIGKLPDVTIADSLQRISGVQVQRTAGEGDRVNIRGLPQVITLLNGEQYLNAGNLGGAQPNLADIPSQLMSGVNVYKSTDLTNALSGISGTIDLKTRRPFQMDEGLTAAGAIEVGTGDYTKETDPMVNALVNWHNDDVGVMFSGVFSNNHLGNNYSGIAAGGFGGLSGNNDWGSAGDPQNYISPHGYESFSRVQERERIGVNFALQADLGEGFEFVAESFYTEMNEWNRAVGLNISNRWNGAAFGNWVQPTASTDTGLAGGDGRTWLAVDEYDVDAWWINSFTVNRVNESASRNVNLELNYDNGGNITGSVRAITASAERLSMNAQAQGDLSNWEAGDGRFSLFRDPNDTTRGTFYPADIAARINERAVAEGSTGYTNAIIGDQGGRYVHPNPLGYGENPQLHYDISGESPVWSGFDTPISGGLTDASGEKTLREYMANLNSYAIGAFSSEGNNESTSDLSVFRIDGNYAFDEPGFGFVTSVDVGIRHSARQVSVDQFHLFSPFYPGSTGATGVVNENGCQAQWKAIDVVMNQNQCSAGEMVPNPIAGQPIVDGDGNPVLDADGNPTFQPATIFQGYTVNPPTRLDEHTNAIWVDDFGSITSGLPGVWAVDPESMDDPEAFHKRVFGAANRTIVPGQTFDVELEETSYTLVGNFESGIVSGNLGVKVIETEMLVKQNLTGDTMNYGDTNADAGDVVTRRDYTDVLPALNVQVQATDDLVFRLAASKTMTPLDLGNYGGGLSIFTADDPDLGIRIVTGASSAGNPQLDPWRSTNFDVSAEYYLGAASLLHAGAFYLDIDSFVVGGQTEGQFPDQDGVIRRTVPVSLNVQGKGGSIEGLEVGAKLAFSDFTSGFISNFGVDTNYTFSPSEQDGTNLAGDNLPFTDNSEHQANLIGWYQGERLQARVAYNYRSERLAGLALFNQFEVYQQPTSYVDVSLSYDVTDEVTVYLNGSNVTGEIEDYELDFGQGDTQYLWQNEFETRYTVGVRATF
jgi:iron complex outermembrane receptor protein